MDTFLYMKHYNIFYITNILKNSIEKHKERYLEIKKYNSMS